MMKELISVIVPVYNVEKYLDNCVQSILRQSYTNLEIILIDDGSTDKSSQLCDEYSQKDKRIKVIHKKNGGQSDARNVGITVATGKYIAFVDSDDYIDEQFLEQLYLAIKKNKSDISMCKYKKTYKLNEKNKKIYNKCIIYSPEEALRELLLFQNADNYIWNKLYKKELFFKLSFKVGKKMEDLGIIYLIFSKAKKIVSIDYEGYFYVQREGSTMWQVNSQLILDTMEMVNERFDYINKKFPQLVDEANINRLVFIKYYFEDIGKTNRKEMMKEKVLDGEYKFYKKNYLKYKREVNKTSNSKVRMLDFYLLYISKNLLVNLYYIKTKLKKLGGKNEKNSDNNVSFCT